ncbi:MAG: cytochrome c3 family protein [Nitrosomonadales bacterium]|nr:cytochrome c3 family protein [Nitrosomonadales bacterium]
MKHLKLVTQSAVVIALMATGFTAYGGGDVVSKASNIGGIINTRHNMTQSFLIPPANANVMDMARNQYGEVCVYCHTPHAANTQISLPLWNRTIPSTTYTTYNSSSMTQPVSQPGPNSLSCLSCHDGTVAIDSIINMPTTGGNPGSANYNQAQETSQNSTFLSSWINSSGINPSAHMTLSSPAGCLLCHSTEGTGALFPSAASFDVFVIGSDLRNDHPVGVRYPAMGPGVDFNATTGTHNNIAYFDGNGNSKLDPGDIRLYNTGQGFEVECASCHDPHGVPSNGVGTVNNKAFMRVSNSGSSLCLTCHVK